MEGMERVPVMGKVRKGRMEGNGTVGREEKDRKPQYRTI